MKIKAMVIMVVCVGLLALIPNVNSESGVMKISWYNARGLPSALIQNETDFAPIISNEVYYISNISKEQHRIVMVIGSFEVETTEITNMTIQIPIFNVQVAGNVSIYVMKGGQSGKLVTWNTNWTHGNRDVGTPYVTPGGDYNTTALDTQYIDTGAQVYTYNILGYLNYTEQSGLILIADSGTNVSIQGWSSSYPIITISYKAGSGETTNLYKDIWNLKGYAGASPKLASTIYSEISNCSALSWKNATSGYWYTYWPSLGLTEDEYLTFGDGLFILTSQDSTWDHT